MGRGNKGVTTMVEEVAPRLVALLLSSGGRSKSELAMVAGVSDVTVQRALAYLRDAGVPVYFSRVALEWRLDSPGEYDSLTLGQLVSSGIMTRGAAVILGYSS